jgi:hypothetical protein
MDPKLDLLILDTHNAYTLGIADLSQYPTGFAIVAPTLQIAPPGFPTVALPFTASSMSILNSENLGLSTAGQDLVKIPDGIYRIKYTVNPAHLYFVEKTFMRTDAIQERFDNAFMTADFSCADRHFTKAERDKLDEIYYLIQESIAAANKCANTLAMNLYNQALKLLDRYSEGKANCC